MRKILYSLTVFCVMAGVNAFPQRTSAPAPTETPHPGDRSLRGFGPLLHRASTAPQKEVDELMDVGGHPRLFLEFAASLAQPRVTGASFPFALQSGRERDTAGALLDSVSDALAPLLNSSSYDGVREKFRGRLLADLDRKAPQDSFRQYLTELVGVARDVNRGFDEKVRTALERYAVYQKAMAAGPRERRGTGPVPGSGTCTLHRQRRRFYKATQGASPNMCFANAGLTAKLLSAEFEPRKPLTIDHDSCVGLALKSGIQSLFTVVRSPVTYQVLEACKDGRKPLDDETPNPNDDVRIYRVSE